MSQVMFKSARDLFEPREERLPLQSVIDQYLYHDLRVSQLVCNRRREASKRISRASQFQHRVIGAYSAPASLP